MAQIAELANAKEQVDFGNDSIVCPLFISGVRGGRTVDINGYTGKYIKAGHVVLFDTTKKEYKLMPVSGSVYGTKPDNTKYVGVVYKTVPASDPRVSIMTNGEVNSVASPYPMTTIQSAFEGDCKGITFVSAEDE